MADTPEEYEWSSYLFYAVEQDKPDWLFTDFILGYFADTYSVAQQKYRSFVRSLIGKQYRSPLTGISLSAILGLPDFVDEIKGRFLSKEKHDGNLPLLKEPGDRPSMEEIAIVVGSTVKENDRVARQMQIHLCHRYTGARLLEIGNLFGIGESAVSQNSKRFSERLSGCHKYVPFSSSRNSGPHGVAFVLERQ